MKQQQYNTALYMRLSRDDELEGESASFKRMIEDIEDGKINCVVTKDLSRLGRNYGECAICGSSSKNYL